MCFLIFATLKSQNAPYNVAIHDKIYYIRFHSCNICKKNDQAKMDSKIFLSIGGKMNDIQHLAKLIKDIKFAMFTTSEVIS